MILSTSSKGIAGAATADWVNTALRLYVVPLPHALSEVSENGDSNTIQAADCWHVFLLHDPVLQVHLLPASVQRRDSKSHLLATATAPYHCCNRRYIRCLYVYNKVDMCSVEECDEIARRPDSIPISCQLRLNMDGLLAKIWDMMALVRVYTKKVGAKPDFEQPVVLTDDRGGTTVKVRRMLVYGTFREFVAPLPYSGRPRSRWGVRYDALVFSLLPCFAVHTTG